MRAIFFIIISLLVISSCKKDARTFLIKGNLYDPQQEIVVESAEVQLLGSKIESGIYNTNYVILNSVTTNSSGEYSMEITDEMVSGYRYYISKDGYFDIYKDIETETLEKNDEFTKDFSLYSKATIKLEVKNTQPFNNDDEIRYRFKNVSGNCRDCCNNLFVTGNGPLYNETKECYVKGNKYIKLEWIVSKAGGTNSYTDSVYCPSFQETTYKIHY